MGKSRLDAALSSELGAVLWGSVDFVAVLCGSASVVCWIIAAGVGKWFVDENVAFEASASFCELWN